MDPIKLTDDYFVLPQIAELDVAELASLGFDIIVNNRPDNESEGQPLSADLAQKSADLGVEYVYNPIDLSKLSQTNLDVQQEVLSSGKKVLAFCRTGTRSSVLWVLNNQVEYGFDTLVEKVSGKGFDLARCLPAMEPFRKA